MNGLYSFLQRFYAILFGFPYFARLNEAIITFCLRGLGINNYENGWISGEEAFLKEAIGNIKNPVVVDVGAHYGEYADLVKKVNSNTQIYSFEPNKFSFNLLKLKEAGGKLHAYQLALGEKEKVSYLYDGINQEGSQFASLYPDVISRIHKLKIIKSKINISTLDKWSTNLPKNSKIDLLKIDVEGNEWDVLKGASKLIKRRKIRFIQFEFNSMNVHSRVFMSDFFKVLPGYTLYRLLPHGKLEISSSSVLRGEIFAFQNIVAILN